MEDGLQTQGQPPADQVVHPGAVPNLPSAATRSEINYPNDQPKPDLAPPSQQGQAKPPQSEQKLSTQENAATDDYQLRMPEGMQLDQDLLNSAVPAFREAGISSDQANKLVPLVTEVQARFQRTQLDQFSSMIKSWGEEAKADQDMGGQNWKETGRLAGVTLRAGGADATNHEVRQILNQSGLGNHPAMIRFFRNIGRELERVRGQQNGPGEGVWKEANRRHQQAVYPNDPPQRWSSFQDEIENSRRRKG